ncbi:MAG TPA: sensor histidine kinase [Methylomirabilota bacterium]|nr:sensor histidine kinase [Methylomirabilota bacterium]
MGLGVAATFCGSTLAGAPLAQLRDVLDLPRAALSTNPAVHVRAVVTCVDKSYKMVFVQDATAGIFLFEHAPRLELSPGDELEIRGVAARGLFSPILNSAQITPVGKTNIPAARRATIAGIISGSLVGERVEVEGIVQRVRKLGDHVFLSLVAGENRCSISIPVPETGGVLNLLDARVRVRGVAAADFDRQQQLTGFQVMLNGPGDLEVISHPPVDAFQSPLRPIGELSRYAGRRSGEHRVRVRGVVTLHWPGRATIVQDATGGVLIEKGVSGNPKTGDEAEVAGFAAPSTAGHRLHNAEARLLGTASEPAAIPVTLAEAGARDNMLVRIKGRVVEWQPPRDGEVIAILSSSNELLAAVLPESGAQGVRQTYPPGCVISAVGVMKTLGAETRSAPRVALWLRGPSDVRLLQPPAASPWKWVTILGAVAAFLALAGAALYAVLTIRHHRVVARMSVQQNNSEQRFAEMERQLRRSHHDRERIAQELHDNIIQSIYSVGLGIDEAIRLAQKSPERVGERLNVAVQSLNALIRDVRSFLVGLEPKGLKGHELKAALKSVLLTSGEDQQARFSIEIDANAARDLNSIQATEVFSIAKEAMSNSMRHAHAPLTKVSLVPYGRGVRLEVADDGDGFDPTQANGDSLGLRNLRNRARNIGAHLEIVSAPGEGTRIVVDIPLSPHDDR